MKKTRLGLIFVIVYLAAVFSVLLTRHYDYLQFLTSPWSTILVLIADYYHAHTNIFNIVNMILSTICNAMIIYLIGIALEGKEP